MAADAATGAARGSAPARRLADVQEAVATLAGHLPDHTAEIQRTRRLPDPVVAALHASGFHRLLVPAGLGGIEAPVLATVDLVETLAAADASTAWCAAIGAGSNHFAGYLPEAGAREVFADPDQGSATMFAAAGRLVAAGGRTRLTGRWPFTSNCLHSGWAGLGAVDTRLEPPEPWPTLVFVRTGDLAIEDTWDADGLRGTGSHHVAANQVTVEDGHTCRFVDPPWPEGPLWRVPLHGKLIPVLTAVLLGIARGALDEIGRQVSEGRVAMRGALTDDPVALGDHGEADTLLRAAGAHVRELVIDAHRRAEDHRPVERPLQARTALACLHAAEVSVAVTSTAHRLGGGAAAYRSSPLLRALSDVHAARQHLIFAHKHRAPLSRIVAGSDERYPPFVA